MAKEQQAQEQQAQEQEAKEQQVKQQQVKEQQGQDKQVSEHVPHKATQIIDKNMKNWVYDVFLWTFSILVDLFFREVHPRGSWRVPRQGPVIFVAAPHANQVCGEKAYSCRLGTDLYTVCRPFNSYAHPEK